MLLALYGDNRLLSIAKLRREATLKKNAEAQFREINEAYEQIKAARGMK